MPPTVDKHDILLNYEPVDPHPRFRKAGLAPATGSVEASIPKSPSWPSGLAPKAAPIDPAPSESDPLTRFAGFDAVVVTWTAAEASALATLFTPGYPIGSWYEYRHNIKDYIPLVTGSRAPFNSSSSEMTRYFHSLGLYMPCSIGAVRVLLVKSGLHLDYDGPAIPVRKLMLEIALAVKPKVFITTGTGGGIGKDMLLGDVVIAGTVRFDCREQFKAQKWAQAGYRASSLTAGAQAAVSGSGPLTSVNATRIPGARPVPRFYSTSDDAVVTTDFFAFDDSTDHYGLQKPGNRACDMGDAMVANAMQEATQSLPHLTWYSIRNASDPQIPNPRNDIQAAEKEASQIYSRYGGLTTAASVIASWAVVASAGKGGGS